MPVAGLPGIVPAPPEVGLEDEAGRGFHAFGSRVSGVKES